MNLSNSKTKVPAYLEPRSLLILEGDARYKWKHEIAARKSDNGLKRLRRISLLPSINMASHQSLCRFYYTALLNSSINAGGKHYNV